MPPPTLREQLALQGITLPVEPVPPTPPPPLTGAGPFGLPLPAAPAGPVALSRAPDPSQLSIGGGGMGPSSAPIELGKNLDVGLLRPKSNLQRDLDAARPAANVDVTPSLVPYQAAKPGLRGAVAGAAGGPGGAGGGGFAWRISPEARKAQEHAFKAQEGANTSIEQRLRDQAVAEQGRAFTHEQQAASDVERSQQIEAERKAKSDALLADYDAAEKDAANTKIDAGRYWSSKPAAQKVLSILGAALGGFAAGLKGGPNVAMEHLNREMDADIDEQKANLANKHAHADARRSAYALNLQAWGNEDAARSATLAQKTAQIQAEAQRQAAEMKSIEAQNQADALNAQLEQQKAAYLQHAMGAVQAAGAGGLPPGVKGDELRFLAQQEEKTNAPQTRAALNRAIAETPKSGDIAGVGPFASWLHDKSPMVHGAIYGKDAERREQDWAQVKNMAMKSIMGNVTAGEEERAKAMFDGARDAESRRRALDNARALLESQTASAESAVSPASAAYYRQQKSLREQMSTPQQAAPPSSFRGAGR